MKLRRLLLRGVLVVGGTTVVCVVGGWLLLHHVPGWYTPGRIPPQHRQRVKDDVLNAFNVFSERVNREPPFEFRMTQDQVNRWLAVREDFGSEVKKVIPPWMTEPAVIFRPDQIGFAAIVDWDGWKSVVSFWFKIDVAGDDVKVRLLNVQAGSLPIPESFVLDQVETWIGQAGAPDKDVAERVAVIRELLAGRSSENRFFWRNGKREFKLVGVTLGDGELTLKAQALPRRPKLPGWLDVSDQDDDGWLGIRTRR